jgi:hypothetical protein
MLRPIGVPAHSGKICRDLVPDGTAHNKKKQKLENSSTADVTAPLPNSVSEVGGRVRVSSWPAQERDGQDPSKHESDGTAQPRSPADVWGGFFLVCYLESSLFFFFPSLVLWSYGFCS